jgi:hypothetical protein
MKSSQHARQTRKDEAAFHAHWERRQKERERLKEERNEPSTVTGGLATSKSRTPQR